MANEIDLYNDLRSAESFYRYCLRNKWRDTAKTARIEIKHITEQIKEMYPDLMLGGEKL
jgi:hypothetical protein